MQFAFFRPNDLGEAVRAGTASLQELSTHWVFCGQKSSMSLAEWVPPHSSPEAFGSDQIFLCGIPLRKMEVLPVVKNVMGRDQIFNERSEYKNGSGSCDPVLRRYYSI